VSHRGGPNLTDVPEGLIEEVAEALRQEFPILGIG